MTIGAKLPSACQWTAKARKSTKFENKNNMATTCGAAVVSLIEELLADNSVLEEASSCENDELLFFLLIDSKERKSVVRTDNYFERIIPLYSFSDFRSHFRMSKTTVSCLNLERLLAACPDLPHEQRNGGRSVIDLEKQVLITMWILFNPEYLGSVADRFNVTTMNSTLIVKAFTCCSYK